MDNQIYYLIYVLSFVIGSLIGLVFSYKKYTEPFVRKNIDTVALVLAIVGWVLALNFTFIPLIPFYILITLGVFLIAVVIGMRPGYGRYETVIGVVVAGIIWILGTVLS